MNSTFIGNLYDFTKIISDTITIQTPLILFNEFAMASSFKHFEGSVVNGKSTMRGT